VTGDGRDLPQPGVLGDAATRHITGRLNKVPALRLRVQALTLDDPDEGSAAAVEMTAEPEVERAYIQARALLVCALDHLNTLRILVVDARVVPAYAHFTLLRGALEPALHARWVVASSAPDRLTRGFALEFENYEERRKFEDSLGEGVLARQRIDELLAAAEQLGLTTSTAAGSLRLTTTVPAYIDLLKLLPRADPEATSEHDDSWVYRFLSGYAHAKAWTTTLGIRQVAEQGAGGVAGRVEAIDAYTVEMVERVWRTVEAAIDEIERLWGTAPTR
jgi:hypothetical protein